jgi:hypothetical protein
MKPFKRKIFKPYTLNQKIVRIVGLIALFIVMTFITKHQLNKNQQKEKIPVSYTKQVQVYKSYQLARKSIAKEGLKRYPDKDFNEKQNSEYKIFYSDYLPEAKFKIKNYYGIENINLEKIIMRGNNGTYTTSTNPAEQEQ